MHNLVETLISGGTAGDFRGERVGSGGNHMQQYSAECPRWQRLSLRTNHGTARSRVLRRLVDSRPQLHNPGYWKQNHSQGFQAVSESQGTRWLQRMSDEFVSMMEGWTYSSRGVHGISL